MENSKNQSIAVGICVAVIAVTLGMSIFTEFRARAALDHTPVLIPMPAIPATTR